MDDKFRSRKFGLAIFATLVATAALFAGQLTGDQWVSVQAWILGLYGAGNVGEHFTSRGSG